MTDQSWYGEHLMVPGIHAIVCDKTLGTTRSAINALPSSLRKRSHLKIEDASFSFREPHWYSGQMKCDYFICKSHYALSNIFASLAFLLLWLSFAHSRTFSLQLKCAGIGIHCMYKSHPHSAPNPVCTASSAITAGLNSNTWSYFLTKLKICGTWATTCCTIFSFQPTSGTCFFLVSNPSKVAEIPNNIILWFMYVYERKTRVMHAYMVRIPTRKK